MHFLFSSWGKSYHCIVWNRALHTGSLNTVLPKVATLNFAFALDLNRDCKWRKHLANYLCCSGPLSSRGSVTLTHLWDQSLHLAFCRYCTWPTTHFLQKTKHTSTPVSNTGGLSRCPLDYERQRHGNVRLWLVAWVVYPWHLTYYIFLYLIAKTLLVVRIARSPTKNQTQFDVKGLTFLRTQR